MDAHGRVIRDLRLSVTDRCNYRCVYCMDPDFRYMPKQQLLSLEEYVAVARVAAGLGIEKLRITGVHMYWLIFHWSMLAWHL